MANVVQPNEILDFDGVSDNIRKVKGEINDFGKEAQKLISILSTETNKYGKEIVALIEALKKIKVTGDPAAPLSDAARKTKELADATKILTQAQADLTNAGKLSSTALKELEAEQKEIIKSYKILVSAEKENSAEALILKERLQQLSEKTNLLNGQLKQAKKATQDATGSYNELQKSLSRDIAELKKLEGVFTTTNGKVEVNKTKIQQLTTAIKGKTDALKEVDKAMGNSQRNVGNYSSAMSFLHGGMRGLIGSAGAVGIAILALGEVARVAGQMFGYLIEETKRMERIETVLKNTSASTAEYEANLSFLRQTAKELALDFEGLANGFKLITGATEGTVLAGGEAKKIFLGVAQASAALQLTAEDTEGALRAVSQMISKGTVQSEELKGQLAERLVGAFQQTAKAVNMTTKELSKSLETGGQLANELLPKLAAQLSKVYSEEALRNAETLNGQTNLLKNNVFELVNEFTKTSGIKEFATTITKALNDSLSSITLFLKSGAFSEFKKYLFGGQDIFETFENIKDNSKVVGLQSKLDRQLGFFQSESPQRRKQIMSNIEKGRESMLGFTAEEKDIKKQNQYGIMYKSYDDHLKKLAELDKKQIKDDADRLKMMADDKLAAQKKRNDKTDKAAQVQHEKDLVKARANYQIELRLIKNAEDGKVFDLEKLEVQGLISKEKYAEERFKIEKNSLNEQTTLIKKFSQGRLSIEESLIDDASKIKSEERKIELGEVKTKMQAIENLYRDYLEEQRRLITVGNAEAAKELMIAFDIIDEEVARKQGDLERRRKGDSKNIKKNPSLNNTYDIEAIGIDMQGIQNKLMKVELLNSNSRFKIEENYQNSVAKINAIQDEGYNKTNALAQAMSDREAALAKQSGDRNVKLAELYKQLEEAKTDKQREELQKRITDEEQAAEKKRTIIEASFNLARELSDSLSQISKSRSEYEVSNLEKQKNYEMGLAGDNAEAKIRIEQEYDKKLGELKRKQAIADKALALFNIGLSTAQAIVSHLGFPILIGFDIAMGALQAATVIATPIPEFAKGKKRGDSYTGIGLVGEAGTEIVEKNGKKQLVDKPTLTYLDPNTTVYTARETERMLADNRTNNTFTQSMDYNRSFVNKSNEYRHNQATQKGIDFSDRNVTEAIHQGFDGINLWLKNDDGSITKKKGRSIVKDNSNRTIYYQ